MCTDMEERAQSAIGGGRTAGGTCPGLQSNPCTTYRAWMQGLGCARFGQLRGNEPAFQPALDHLGGGQQPVEASEQSTLAVVCD